MEMISDFLSPFIFIGSEGILIEGVKSVYKWEEGTMDVRAGNKRLTVCGRKLRPEYKSGDSLLIKGKIEKIELGRSKA